MLIDPGLGIENIEEQVRRFTEELPATILQHENKTAFSLLKAEGKLHHGSGTHNFDSFSVWL